MEYFTLTIGDVTHSCVLFTHKLTSEPEVMKEVARGSADAPAKFGEAKLTPVQAAAAYAAARFAIARRYLERAAAVGSVGGISEFGERWLERQVAKVRREQIDWLQTACDVLGEPVAIEKAAEMLDWMVERMSGFSRIGW